MASTSTAKTPVRPRHARPPLTPSAITTNFNSLSLSPTKGTSNAADSSNPFVQRPSQPKLTTKKSFHGVGVVNMEHMGREAQRGIIRPGGIETKFDVVKHDYVVPTKEDGGSGSSSPRKRSASVGTLSGSRSRKLSSSQTSVSISIVVLNSKERNLMISCYPY